MRLADWARQQGIPYKTAWLWFKRGQMPAPAIQTPSGTILVQVDPPPGVGEKTRGGKTIIYARVSSHDQKGDLQRQARRLRDFCAAKGILVSGEVLDVGSGLNGRRKGLLRILSDRAVGRVVVEHKDRLARFGSEMVEASLKASGREILSINEGDCKDDLVEDFVDLATSMCARIYGRRSARNRAMAAAKAAGMGTP